MESIPQPAACETDSPSAASVRALPLILLLILGTMLAYLFSSRGALPGLTLGTQLILIAMAAIVAAAPVVSRAVSRGLEAIRNPSPRARAWTAVAIGTVAFVYLLCSARQQHRDLFPRIHDECSYLIQTRMLAQGKLWEPRHELADFFESFHFLTQPVYGSIYFPGTALMNVPGVWLRQPSWFVPLLLAATVIAMSYRVAAEMVDGAAGMLVALLVLCTCMFRVYSTMIMAQVPLMLLGLLMAWAWLHWRRTRGLLWAMAVGALAGWAAITRPVDALAFALPIGIAMAWDVFRRNGEGAARTLAALLAGAAPFLALQAAFDVGVTGHVLKTPYVYYLEQNQPGSVFGSNTGQLARPASALLQKQIYFAQLAGTEVMERQARIASWIGLRLRMTAGATLPCAAILIFLPAGLLLARERGRWVLLLAVPVFLICYTFNPFFLLHYTIPLAAAVALCAVLGIRAVERANSSPAYQRFAGTFLSGALVLLAVGSLPQVNSRVSDEPYRTPLLDHVESALAEIRPPAVVFFRFTPGCNVHEEPVYNLQTTWPDDAPIVRAQDLGPRNGELLRYYAARQPDRSYYIMDRRSGILLPLGDAPQAAAALQAPFDPPRTATADVR